MLVVIRKLIVYPKRKLCAIFFEGMHTRYIMCLFSFWHKYEMKTKHTTQCLE